MERAYNIVEVDRVGNRTERVGPWPHAAYDDEDAAAAGGGGVHTRAAPPPSRRRTVDEVYGAGGGGGGGERDDDDGAAPGFNEFDIASDRGGGGGARPRRRGGGAARGTRRRTNADETSDAAGGGGGVDDDVVADFVRAPLDGFAWVTRLPEPTSSYCYVCCTEPSAENVFLAAINLMLEKHGRMPDDILCHSVHRLYRETVQRFSTESKPDWSVRAIYDHLTLHCATPEAVTRNILRVTTAQLREYAHTAQRRDGVGGARVALDAQETKVSLAVMAMQLRASAELQRIAARPSAAGGGGGAAPS